MATKKGKGRILIRLVNKETGSFTQLQLIKEMQKQVVVSLKLKNMM